MLSMGTTAGDFIPSCHYGIMIFRFNDRVEHIAIFDKFIAYFGGFVNQWNVKKELPILEVYKLYIETLLNLCTLTIYAYFLNKFVFSKSIDILYNLLYNLHIVNTTTLHLHSFVDKRRML